MLIAKIKIKMANKKSLISNVTQIILELVKTIILKILSCSWNKLKIINKKTNIWTKMIKIK